MEVDSNAPRLESCHSKTTIRAPCRPSALAARIAVKALATRASSTCTTTRSIAISQSCKRGRNAKRGGTKMCRDRAAPSITRMTNSHPAGIARPRWAAGNCTKHKEQSVGRRAPVEAPSTEYQVRSTKYSVEVLRTRQPSYPPVASVTEEADVRPSRSCSQLSLPTRPSARQEPSQQLRWRTEVHRTKPARFAVWVVNRGSRDLAGRDHGLLMVRDS